VLFQIQYILTPSPYLKSNHIYFNIIYNFSFFKFMCGDQYILMPITFWNLIFCSPKLSDVLGSTVFLRLSMLIIIMGNFFDLFVFVCFVWVEGDFARVYQPNLMTFFFDSWTIHTHNLLDTIRWVLTLLFAFFRDIDWPVLVMFIGLCVSKLKQKL